MTHVAATLFGAPLPPGGTIGVCSPSGPFYNRSDIERPVEWWQERGFHVKLSEGVWAQDDYVAGSPQQRASDLNALFGDPEVDVIQVLWGGTGAMQVLPHLDYDLIAANPKALMGYSISRTCTSRSANGPGSPHSTAQASAPWGSPSAPRSPGIRRCRPS